MCSWRKSTCAKRQRIRCFSASQLKSTKEVQSLHFVRDQRLLGFIIKLYQCVFHKDNVMNLLTSRRLSWIMSKTVDYFNTFRICRFVTLLWKACHLYNNYLRVNGLKWYIIKFFNLWSAWLCKLSYQILNLRQRNCFDI